MAYRLRSRNVGGIDVVLILFGHVTPEALFGGVGHNRLVGISPGEELKSSAAGRGIFLRVLHHDRQPLAVAHNVGAVGDGKLM